MNFNSDLTSKRRWSSAATSCDSSPARTFKSWSPRKLRDCNRLYLTKFPNLNPSQFSICNLYNLYIYIYINYNHRITVITYQCIIIYMESSCTNLHGASSTCFHGSMSSSFFIRAGNQKHKGWRPHRMLCVGHYLVNLEMEGGSRKKHRSGVRSWPLDGCLLLKKLEAASICNVVTT